MLPAALPTLAELRTFVSDSTLSDGAGASFAPIGGESAGFEAFLGAAAEAAGSQDAKTQERSSARGSAAPAPIADDDAGDVDRSPMHDEAQERAANAQYLPVSVPGARGEDTTGTIQHQEKGGGEVRTANQREHEVSASGDRRAVASKSEGEAGLDDRRLAQDEQSKPQRAGNGRGPVDGTASVELREAASGLEPREASSAVIGASQAVEHSPQSERLLRDVSGVREQNERHAAQPQPQPQTDRADDRHWPVERSVPRDSAQGRREAPLLREQGALLPPAAARAEQIDTMIRLEQATGQRASAQSPHTPSAPEQSTASSNGRSQPRSQSQSQPQSQSAPEPPAHPSPPAGPPHAQTQPPSHADPSMRLAPPAEGQTIAPQQNQHATSSQVSATAHNESHEQSPLTSRIVRGLTAMVNQRGGSLTMRLDPPELGSMRVQMTISRGTVAAQITASTAQAHGLLEKNLAMLRTALESHGLSVERLTVHLSGASSHGSHAQQHQHHQPHQPQHQDSARTAQQDAHADAGEGQSRGRRDEEYPHHARRDSHDEAEPQTFSRFIRRHDAVSTGATTR